MCREMFHGALADPNNREVICQLTISLFNKQNIEWIAWRESDLGLRMPSNPSALPRDISSLRRMIVEKETLLSEREQIIAEKEAQLAERDRLIAARDPELYSKTLQIEQLRAQLAVLRRARFGRSSEKLDREIEQLELLLGKFEEGVAESKVRA